MKHIKLFLFIFMMSSTAFAESIRVGVLNGPTCIPAAYLMENDKKVSFQQFADPQALLPKMIKKEIDIGFMPLNVAAKVYNSSNKSIICCAVTGLGNLKIITTDPELRHFSDLKGRTVYVAGQGATPEYMFKYLLDENKLTYGSPDEKPDVVLDFSIPTAQLTAQLISGKIWYAAVPEPFATIAQLKSPNVRAVLDFQQEYLAITGEQDIYPLSVMVVRKEFADKNPELVDEFLSDYKNAFEWTVKYPETAGRLSEKFKLGLSADIVTKSVPVSNYTFIPSSQAVTITEELLRIFLKNDSASIGGKLPDKKFYYEGKADDKSQKQ